MRGKQLERKVADGSKMRNELKVVGGYQSTCLKEKRGEVRTRVVVSEALWSWDGEKCKR